MQEYVLGFPFDMDGTRVALTRKVHPKWQAGRFNGFGGKVNEGESPLEAMQREFGEATHVTPMTGDWDGFCSFWEDHYKVYCFRTLMEIDELKPQSSESIGRFNMQDISQAHLVRHVDWLVPLAANYYRDLIISVG